jgi:hypothetical protein
VEFKMPEASDLGIHPWKGLIRKGKRKIRCGDTYSSPETEEAEVGESWGSSPARAKCVRLCQKEEAGRKGEKERRGEERRGDSVQRRMPGAILALNTQSLWQPYEIYVSNIISLSQRWK